jgi:hypothetical protein
MVPQTVADARGSDLSSMIDQNSKRERRAEGRKNLHLRTGLALSMDLGRSWYLSRSLTLAALK